MGGDDVRGDVMVMWGSCSGFVNGIARHCPVIDISAAFSS